MADENAPRTEIQAIDQIPYLPEPIPFSFEELDHGSTVPAISRDGGFPTSVPQEEVSMSDAGKNARRVFFRWGTIPGDQRDLITGTYQKKSRKEWLSQLRTWEAARRNELIGKKSWFRSWVAGEVSMENVRVIIDNLWLEARYYEIPPPHETPEERTLRLEKVRELDDKSIKQGVIFRTAIQIRLKDERNLHESLQSTAKKRAERTINKDRFRVDFYEKLDVPYLHRFGARRFATRAQVKEQFLITFGMMSPEGQQDFWMRRWGKDVFTSWLWSYRSSVSLYAAYNSKELKHIWHSRFVVSAIDLWNLDLGPEACYKRIQLLEDATVRLVSLPLNNPDLQRQRWETFDQDVVQHAGYEGMSLIHVSAPTGSKRLRERDDVGMRATG